MKLVIATALAALVLVPAASEASLPRIRAVVVSATSGAKLAETTGSAPRPLSAAIGDGRGGFFAAGANGVVRLRADGTRDPGFTAPVDAVSRMVLASGTLVTASAAGLRFLDPRTGTERHPLLPLAPGGTKVFVGAIAASGPRVFVVGSTQRGSGGSSQLAFGSDVRTGLRTAFHPIVRNGVANQVAAFGQVVYLGGTFKHVAGVARCGIAAVGATTGALRPWKPEVCLGDSVYAMTASAHALYIGRLHAFYALRADSGRRLSWSSRVSKAVSGLGVSTLALAGRTLYLGTVAGARPVSIGGSTRAGYLALDTANGHLRAWRVTVARFQNSNAVAVSGARVLVSGSFRVS
jgi:hypothetical protein